ncbi:hypothetical protein H0G86_010209 [Trichoderma simmonsii]|uniref:Uncharacterized protein n=1 Tax=Trichoderma simmonsii TaxID=1491479 RepID=A0A8G0LJ27_9HYPO|nr:hypothetical protein H0G86_010209 [Trichoderma simmonsii]
MENSIIARLAGFSHELTVTAANLNFDFTLIKVEAPKEYSGVNDSLTEVRRENAENGALHRTARKLGALFDGIPPPAEHLLAAYGNRVSEICQKAKITPQDRERYGIFARYCGTDSSSLWAAATSGTNAIAIHLLACMLAEAFTGPESVALWVQLIERRKAEIGATNKDATSIEDLAKALACKQEFSRDELASWDNSARSWVQTASKKTKEQRSKVLLYTDKAGLAVNKNSDPYHSAMVAWKDAMSSMDSLIMGVPQKVRNGAILLAIRSWHLYPDLCVLSHGPDVIPQGDGLIPKSGIITIDLEHPDETAGSISWSLPLSYLRYYGDPVMVNQTLSVTSNRISMDHFRFVLLGCVISTWSTFANSADTSIDLLGTLMKALRWPERSTPDPENLKRMQEVVKKTSWLGQILTAAEDLSSDSEIERATARKLMEYGRRYGQFLCHTKDHPPAFFGLSYIPFLFSLLEDSEARIGYLRRYAKFLGLSNSNCVIRYFDSLGHPEFATIEPIDEHFGSKTLDGYIHQSSLPSELGIHLRWIPVESNSKPCFCEGICQETVSTSTFTRMFRFGRPKKEACPCIQNGGCSINCHDNQAGHNYDCLLLPPRERIDKIEQLGERCLPVHMITSTTDPDDDSLAFGSGENFLDAFMRLSQEQKNLSYSTKSVILKFCIGDDQTAEILSTGPMTKISTDPDPRERQFGPRPSRIGLDFPADFIKETFEVHPCNYDKLIEWFTTEISIRRPVYTQALRACASALEMYGRLPDATVDPTIVSKISLADASWIFPSGQLSPSPARATLSRPEAFACITMFECGQLQDVTHFREVFAITSNDAMFVATPLLADPHDVPIETEIKRVLGNIGKPGVSLLVPPPGPRVREMNTNEWNLLNHNSFSGEIENSFQKTSMHLSFTQYQQGLLDQTKNEHHIDSNTVLHEALVQVFDSSTWVGDLDVLSTLKSPLVSRVHCNCSGDMDSSVNTLQQSFRMIIVDNWEELMIPPLDPAISVVRTAGNWIGRLAAVGISTRMGRLTVVLPSNKCWMCTRNHVLALKEPKEKLDQLVLIL